MITLLVVEGAFGQFTLRLERGGRSERQGIARGGGHVLTHAEAHLDGHFHLAVHALGSALAALGPNPRPLAKVLESLGGAAAGVGAEVRPGPRWPAGLRFPRWPARMRVGPTPASGGLWPFDPELAGLQTGQRLLVKREPVDEADAAADRAWLEGHGCAVGAAVEGRGAIVYFAGRDTALIGEALTMERAAVRGSDEAARWLGERLGYPACCVEAFVDAGRRDDASLAATRLPGLGSAPASPLSQWLLGPLALVSHVPCSLQCPATARMASALLEALDTRAPGLADRWRDLAARLQVVTESGRCLALCVTPWVDQACTIVDAVEIRVDPSVGATATASPLARQRLAIEDGALVGPNGFRAPFVANHHLRD